MYLITKIILNHVITYMEITSEYELVIRIHGVFININVHFIQSEAS